MTAQEVRYWDEPLECMPRPQLEQYQLAKLRDQLGYIRERSPFYRRKFDSAHVVPGDICSLDAVRRLPFIHKQDFRDAYPWSLLSVGREELRELHASSGTTGSISLTGYTVHDLATWSELIARVFGCAGAKPGDIVHNAYGYGLFTGGLGFHYGAQRFGCTVLPMSGGNTARQIRMMRDLRPDILCCTPSYALHLAEAWRGLLHRARLSRHHHISREELSVREHMSAILRALRERRVLEFAELFQPERGVAVLVVTFLALLELARELLIEITQAECFAPIYVKLGYAQSA